MTQQLPDGWIEVEIGHCLKLTNGYPFKPAQWSREGLPIIRIQNLNNPAAPFNRCDEKIPDKVRVRKGDLLFAWSGTPGTSFGAHIWEGGDAWLNQHIFKVEYAPSQFDKTFLRHAINMNLNEYIADAHGGAGLAHITKGRFEASTLRVPPIQEQRRIVAKLNSVLARVIACQQRLEKIPTLVTRFRETVLSAACSGRLTQSWRCQTHSSTTPQTADLSDETFPPDWQTKTLGSMSTLVTSGSRGWARFYATAGPKFIRAQNISGDCLNLDDVAFVSPPGGTEGLRTRVQRYDLLVTITGANVGKTALVEEELGDAYVSQHVGLIRLGDKELSGFAFLWLLSRAHGRGELLEAAYGQGKPGLNLNNLRNIEIAFPPAEEQGEILRIVKKLLGLADRLEARVTTAQKRVGSLRQSVLSRAFRGDLVQTDEEIAELKTYESDISGMTLAAARMR